MTAVYEVRLDSMSRWNDVSDVIRGCTRARRDGIEVQLHIDQVSSAWPNAIVPIAAALQHYRAAGQHVKVMGETPRLRATHFRNPVEASVENLRSQRMMNTVWVYFDEKEAIQLTRELVHTLERTIPFGPGVLEALNFCLYEVLDNVFQHSGADAGYLMAVLTNQGTRLALSVADTGIGVFNSFRDSTYNPPTHLDALTLAVQAGVTSTGDKRGNGLYALRGTVEQNCGRLVLHSGPGVLRIEGDSATGQDYLSTPVIDSERHGLALDWQLDLERAVSLHEVLGMPVVNSQLEDLENDSGEHVIQISEHEAGTGTRRAAEQLRLYMVNLLSQGAPNLTLNFDGVTVVSASFADEVIGKLAEEYGPVRFFSTFKLRNMGSTVEALLDRAIRLRISNEPPPPVMR